VLLPLSVIFVRWFPELGRNYSRSGGLQITELQCRRISCILVVICGLVLLWEWLERSRSERSRLNKIERYLPMGFFLIGAYLIYLCDSKTSIVCLILGAAVLLSIKLPLLRKRVSALESLFWQLLQVIFYSRFFFGIKEALVGSLGVHTTFTGRTDVWRELLAQKRTLYLE
jgi:O-antigen ligase